MVSWQPLQTKRLHPDFLKPAGFSLETNDINDYIKKHGLYNFCSAAS
jgi:hypothetical protein